MSRHTEIQQRLNEFVDGETGPAERNTIAAHLAECEACRTEVAELRALQAAARTLPREVSPSRDLWQGIAERLGLQEAAPPESEVIAVDFASRRRPVWQRWGGLAAAAMVLVVLSSGITAYLMGGQTGVSAVATMAVRPSSSEPATALVAFRPAEQEYLGAVEMLEAELASQREQLSPETVETIEENMQIIDQAIREARAALEADPASVELPLLLSSIYRRKVELLEGVLHLTVST